MMKQRILFIDIDGPVINTPMFYLDSNCSMGRTQMNTQALAYVVRLCKIAGAKIVTNSTHNTHNLTDPLTGSVRTLKDDLIRWGVPKDLFHDRWRTNYPGYRGRLSAIQDWINDVSDEVNADAPPVDNINDTYSNIDWVCFDDEKFTNSNRLIVIDYDKGIDYAAYRKAAKVWGFRNDPIWVGN
jgi:hypothetical protein